MRFAGAETHFQPIFDAAERHVFGHEALTRLPDGSPFADPAELLAAAAVAAQAPEVDLRMLSLAIERFGERGGAGKLFVNILPQTLLATEDLAARLRAWLGAAGLDPRQLVVELTEHGLGEDPGGLHVRVQQLRTLGCEFAIDDLGAGSSGLRLWSALRPDYVKIDRFFTASVEDPVEAEILRSMLDMAHVMGSRVVAEGVETAAQCTILREMGVDCLQGYLLARPGAVPLDVDIDHSGRWVGIADAAPVANCAGDLLVERPPVHPDCRIADLMLLFQQQPDWDSIAVVDAGRPVGQVRRDSLLTLLSRPLHPEIYHRKPVSAVMDAPPTIVDERARLDQTSRLVTGAIGRRVNEDFLITRGGQYAGVGRTIELLRQITAWQVEAARQSNPLTRLPGNRQVDDELGRLLALRTPFVVCHADLDHFKAYNDEYGYRQGDQVLMHVAELLRGELARGSDFLGHIGGDDFVLLMRSPDWMRRLQRMLDSLAASVPNFYSARHLKQGGLHGVDRTGRSRDFPLMTLSIGAVQAPTGTGVSREVLLERLTQAKHRAKEQPGNALFLLDADGLELEIPGWSAQPSSASRR